MTASTSGAQTGSPIGRLPIVGRTSATAATPAANTGFARSAWLVRLLPWVCFLGLTWAAALIALAIASDEYGLSTENHDIELARPWAALLVPCAVIALAVRAYGFRKRSPQLLVSRAEQVLAGRRGWRAWLRPLVDAMRATALLFLAVALTGPQSVEAKSRTEVEGIDIMLVLDLSGSMEASDIEPNRHRAMLAVVEEFVDRRPNDRIGIVGFAKDAYTVLPLTTDHDAITGTVRELELGVIDSEGTAIGNALGVAINRLHPELRDHKVSPDRTKTKIIILLTDGDSNAGNVSPDGAASWAEALGTKIFTVLMGESASTRKSSGLDQFGRAIWGGANHPINPELLKRIAERSKGEAFSATDRRSLHESFHQILNRLEKSVISDAGRVHTDLFAAFAWPGLILLIIELLLGTLVLRRWP